MYTYLKEKISILALASMVCLTSAATMVSCAKNDVPGESTTVYVDGQEITMVRIPAATFTMGGTPEQTECDFYAEKPAHKVVLTKAFYISQTEVTQGLWEKVMGNNPSAYKGDGDEGENLPVTNVTWDDCQRFVKKLSAMTGKTFRLPTEAEWEFAARGAGRGYNLPYAGSKFCDRVACMATNSDMRPHSVGQFGANEAGLYDMSGNVWEWVADDYADYKDSVYTDPLVRDTLSGSKVAKGGSFADRKSKCRTSTRSRVAPDYSHVTLGFRIAMD
ncbi:MAG: SUMF1/EgtB/PvdO family nonheme iron enzyme [Bacteroidales bacterium]|nr:SUMF1/EgtB/PvdO family nonheme iron enzyme [Bacteroidales bacterium]